MKIFNVPVTIVSTAMLSTFQGSEVEPQQFQKWLEGEQWLKRLRQRGTQTLQHVRSQRKQARQSSLEACQAYLKAFEANVDQALETAKSEAIQKIVKWNQTVKAIEAETYNRWFQRAKDTLDSMLSQTFSKLPWGLLLSEALQNTLLSQAHDTIGAIHFHPEHESALKEVLEGYPNLHLVSSEELPLGCARLETEYFTILIEVPQQLEALKQAFLNPATTSVSEEAQAEPEQPLSSEGEGKQHA